MNTDKLCENQDCNLYTEDSEDNQWKKCSICEGYFEDNGLNDILFIEDYRHSCDLCGKNRNIVRMKDTGQYLCGNACDDDTDEENGYCSSCTIRLDHRRDGTEEDGNRCHNCYWEEEGSNIRNKDVPNLIYPDYRLNLKN